MITKSARKKKALARRRRGVVAVQVGLMGTVIFGLTALTIDVGYLYMANAEMQRAADASALAGASALLLGSTPVHQRAITAAAQNPVIRSPVTPGELNVVIGNWEARSLSFTPSGEGDTFLPNAVHVTGARPSVPLFFARVLGFNESDVEKEAIALFGAGRCAGIWGLEGVTADGSIITDSYDSSQGSYGASSVHANGDVCSCQDVVANGNIEIRGDAMYGEGYSFLPSGTAYSVWGVIADHACNVPPFEADFAAAAVDNDNATIGTTTRGRDPFAGSPWDLYITGNDSLTLAGGTYYFTSVLIDGQGVVNVTGPTTIFCCEYLDVRRFAMGRDPMVAVSLSFGVSLIARIPLRPFAFRRAWPCVGEFRGSSTLLYRPPHIPLLRWRQAAAWPLHWRCRRRVLRRSSGESRRGQAPHSR